MQCMGGCTGVKIDLEIESRDTKRKNFFLAAFATILYLPWGGTVLVTN